MLPVFAEGALKICLPAASSRTPTAATLLQRRLLQLWDGVSVFATGMLCAILYMAMHPYESILSPPPDGFVLIAMRISLVTSLVAPFVFQDVRLPGKDRNWPSLLGQVIAKLGILVGLMLAIGFSMQALAYVPRAWAFMWSVAIATAVVAGRLVIFRLQDFAGLRGILRQKVVILGEKAAADALCSHLRGSAAAALEIVGVFRGDEARSLQECSLDLIAYGKQHPVDRVLIAPSASTDPGLLRTVVNQLKALNAEVALCPCLIGETDLYLELVHVAGVPFVCLTRRPLDLGSLTLKTIEDKFLAALLIILVSPLMAAIAIAIWLDSSGPLIFRQRRYGLNNAEFDIWKFRTMVSTSGPLHDGELRQTERGDTRLTRMGRFLRRSSLDELPQLFNVLQGHMSLVGPRPHPVTMRTEGRLGSDIMPDYAHRHRVKPGMTGWAQINGSRGATRTMDEVRRRVEFDMFYVENWSILLDLKILALTPVSMVLDNNNAF